MKLLLNWEESFLGDNSLMNIFLICFSIFNKSFEFSCNSSQKHELAWTLQKSGLNELINWLHFLLDDDFTKRRR